MRLASPVGFSFSSSDSVSLFYGQLIMLAHVTTSIPIPEAKGAQHHAELKSRICIMIEVLLLFHSLSLKSSRVILDLVIQWLHFVLCNFVMQTCTAPGADMPFEDVTPCKFD